MRFYCRVMTEIKRDAYGGRWCSCDKRSYYVIGFVPCVCRKVADGNMNHLGANYINCGFWSAISNFLWFTVPLAKAALNTRMRDFLMVSLIFEVQGGGALSAIPSSFHVSSLSIDGDMFGFSWNELLGVPDIVFEKLDRDDIVFGSERSANS